MCAKSPQSCLMLCNCMDCNLLGSSVHGILQARILEWAAIPFSRESSKPRSPALQADSLPSEPSGKSIHVFMYTYSCSLEGMMLKLKLQYFGYLMWRVDSLEKTLMLGGIGARRKGDDRGWDGWMASPTRWTWVWVNSGSWWWTGRPGVLQFMGLPIVGHAWASDLIWSDLILYWCFSFWLTSLCIIGSSFIHLIKTDSNALF